MHVKIALADLAHTYSVEDQSLPVPLNIGYIKAYCVAAFGDEVSIELFKHPEKFLAYVESEAPDIVGMAHYGWNDNLNRAVGRHIRENYPETLIVGGGPNLDTDPVLQLRTLERHDYLDFFAVDGGEEPFAEIIEWWREGSRRRDQLPQNFIWRENRELKRTETRALRKQITNIPSPYLDGYLDEFLNLGMVPLFETNRGCPFKCTFCAWGEASKDLVRRLDFDTTIAEIDYVGRRSRAHNWIVCDANFGILKRDVDIARAIRAVKDEHGTPVKTHVWLSKNTMQRNLEIAEILGDMVVPVMAVQSLDEAVLENIKRDNITTDTYVEYQKKFHKLGSQTYSDLIVPLPGETLSTHLDALRRLCDYGVDILQNHNMRLLSGAETNSLATRERYDFQTKYRLIHGDAGEYKLPNGDTFKVFEYEESLRQTNTMPEAEVFFLRKLHFLVDFAWNLGVYKPLLRVGHLYDVNPIDVLMDVLALAEGQQDGNDNGVVEFMAHLDAFSHEEWFDSEADIEAYFSEEENFSSLVNQEFEKLNILFSLILLKECKPAFDAAFVSALRKRGVVPEEILRSAADMTFAAFPPLGDTDRDLQIEVPDNLENLTPDNVHEFKLSENVQVIRLVESERRQTLQRVLSDGKGKTLSKVLNTQGLSLRDLKFKVADGLDFDKQFRRAV